ncbi:terminase [Streptomyces fructofermentans]|uniref:Terminase n=1 Tax=Streptomyces fructofermentans TaxID=152141 RepID=A0A918U6L1_9ACTN|nr:terminase [Streptomyces fructofermentans]GGX98505.1 terminase [Streptomyces fructofermentans]
MPWKPPEPGAVPTLGFEVIDWITELLAAPDRGEYEPFVLYPEQEDFVLRYYEINPRTGKRRFRRGVISRSRGWGKSPFLAALAIAEALGPVVPDGWDESGQPVGKPWSTVRTPLVQIAAVSETQTKNTWVPLLEMLDGPILDAYPGLEPLDTFVNLPRGRIEPITSSARTVKGNKPVFAVLDQTEEWVRSNGGPRLAQTMRINAAKVGGTTIESPNAFIPGEGSVAEESAAFWAKIREGKARDDGLYYDHREAPPETDLEDRVSLLSGLAFTYGDSADRHGGHVDLDTLVATIWDPSTDPQVARADFLNQITHASDAWLSQPEWAACAAPGMVVADREAIVLGFDGSRRRNRGVTDATALVGCRVSDGHLFQLRVWEQPEGPSGRDWQVPVGEVLAEVDEAFKRYRVIGMYADPAKWESHIAGWEARYGAQLLVKSSVAHPIEWWMTGGRALQIVRATRAFHDAVTDQELTHDGASALMRHVLNARRRESRAGIQIAKAHPDSSRKIDAAVASILAWQCRLDALAKGAAVPERSGTVYFL